MDEDKLIDTIIELGSTIKKLKKEALLLNKEKQRADYTIEQIQIELDRVNVLSPGHNMVTRVRTLCNVRHGLKDLPDLIKENHSLKEKVLKLEEQGVKL